MCRCLRATCSEPRAVADADEDAAADAESARDLHARLSNSSPLCDHSKATLTAQWTSPYTPREVRVRTHTKSLDTSQRARYAARVRSQVRSSLNGLSAAAGKVGAILGTTIFEKLLGGFDDENEGVRAILFLCTAASSLGALVTAAGVGVTLPGCARRRADAQHR
eukprot:3219589-Pleurochrysis_carterae.AAC.9